MHCLVSVYINLQSFFIKFCHLLTFFSSELSLLFRNGACGIESSLGFNAGSSSGIPLQSNFRKVLFDIFTLRLLLLRNNSSKLSVISKFKKRLNVFAVFLVVKPGNINRFNF